MDINLTAPRIHSRRVELGITQVELAKMIGVKHSTIQRYETGVIKNLKRNTIEDLSKALSCSPLWLMGYEDESPEEELDPNELLLDPEISKLVKQFSRLTNEQKRAVSYIIDEMVADK